jgi:glutamate dehydrogenase/leucine dehydrogenase
MSPGAGRRVLVQGAGSVGGELARMLAGAGAEVLVSDVPADRAAAVAVATGARVIPAAGALEASCEVYAPCAVGGTLSSASIPGLRCRIVAGSANNQLAEPEDAERLRAAGILYAPDYVINAGGVLQDAGLEESGRGRPVLEQELAAIGTTLRSIYARADADGISTEQAAERLAASHLAAP